MFSLFMQHNRSTFIWLNAPLLSYTQFPWRFMGLTVFYASLIGASAAIYLKKGTIILALLLIAAAILVNYSYFRPDSYYLDSIDEHYVSKETLSKDDRIPSDYLPIWVGRTADRRDLIPEAETGKIEVNNFIKNSHKSSFDLEVIEDATIVIPITYFPNWKVNLSGNEIITLEPNNEGLIRIEVPEGVYQVRLVFGNTPIRTFGNVLSAASLLLLIVMVVKPKLFKRLWQKK